jgi:hypothetical protein
VGDDDGAELAQSGSSGSLLGKFDLKSLLSKKDKGVVLAKAEASH